MTIPKKFIFQENFLYAFIKILFFYDMQLLILHKVQAIIKALCIIIIQIMIKQYIIIKCLLFTPNVMMLHVNSNIKCTYCPVYNKGL